METQELDEKDLDALEGYGELLLKSDGQGERYLGALTSIVARMVRLLPAEERTRLFERVQAGEGETALFITPGFRFRMVDCLITNFHLPRSTLLMLVAAFAGLPNVLAAYRHAVAQRYRFFSYGDAMFISRRAA